jgi:aminopeptidase N
MRVAAVLSTIVVFGTLVSADTYPRQPAVDAVHYRFAITLGDDSPQITGEATVTFRVIAPVSHIELDLIGASAADASAPGMRVMDVKAGAATVSYTHSGDRLKLAVPNGTSAGSDVTYTIRYGGVPADGLKVFTNLHGTGCR